MLVGGDRVRLLLEAAADGHPPVADGQVEVLPQAPGPVAGILAFAGHHVVAADVEPGWVHARLEVWDMNAPMAPPFVAAMTERLGVAPDNLDLVLAGRGTGQGAPDLVPSDDDHPRIRRAREYRRDVRAWTTADGDGLLILGRGLAGRWEAAFEVHEGARGRGLGRALAAAAIDLVPTGEAVFVQVAPGNVPSVRAVLATGRYRPIGGELLFPVGEGQGQASTSRNRPDSTS